MKKVFLYLGIGLMFFNTHAQFGPQQIVSDNTEGAYLSIPLDLDNDGNMDILKASLEYFDLKWHRNLNGLGDFGPEINISNITAYYLSVDFIDMDSDGDNDLLLLENNPRRLFWLENLDGYGNFDTEQIILENQQEYIKTIYPVDIDLDNDIDLLVLFQGQFDDKIVWYENLDGLGSFSDEILIIDEPVNVYTSLIMEDLDDDGFLDIITAYEYFSGPGKIVWYKNLGNSNFDTERIIYEADFIASDNTSIYGILYKDINTDNKKDIVFVTHNDDFGTYYKWIESIDNQGNFDEVYAIPNYGRFYDIDNDGDNDILAGNRFVNRLYWVENTDGLGTFSIEHDITTEIDFLKDFYASDFNNDGLLDILSASLGDDKIAWYENLGTIGIEDHSKHIFSIYPNPTKGNLTLNSNQDIKKIEIYNLLGQKVSEILNQSEIDISHFDTGIYFLKIMDDLGNSEIHKIIKE